MNTSVMFSSNTDNWATPQYLFDELNKEFQFTLDPCASQDNAKCENFFTKEEDGLKQNWGGQKVFCNPPYGKEIGKWVEKCSIESQKPNTICVMLVPARTDTKWFHEFIYNKAEIRFLKGRLKFGNSTNSAPFPSMIVIFAKCKNLRIMEIRQIKPCKCYWYKITGDKEKDAALLDKLKDLMPDTTYLYQPNMDIEGRKGRIVYNNVNHIEVINDVDRTFSQIVKMLGVELKVKE